MLIAQISDLHLCAPGELFHDVFDSNAAAARAIQQLQELPERPDVVVVSGDIADHGDPAEYEVANQLFGVIEQPLILVPGNHDRREAFRSAFADRAPMSSAGPLHVVAADLGPVRIIGLDITVPGLHHGDFDDAAAGWLERVLADEPDRPTMIAMHQPPFTTGIPYMDRYGCRQGERLAELVRRYPAVELMICGHVHRCMTVRFGGTVMCSAPSTATAVALRVHHDAEPASYLEPPVLLLHRWTRSSGFITHYLPIGAFHGPLPFT